MEETPPDEDAHIPDWMKDAEWATASKEGAETGEEPAAAELETAEEEEVAAEPSLTRKLEQDGTEGDEIEAAEIPGWLQDMAPVEGEQGAGLSDDEEEMSHEIPPWLNSTPPGPTDSVVIWLDKKKSEIAKETGELSVENLPDLDAEIPESEGLAEQPEREGTDDDVPDWLESVADRISRADVDAEIADSAAEQATDADVPPEAEPISAGENGTEELMPVEDAAEPEPTLEDTQPRRIKLDDQDSAPEAGAVPDAAADLPAPAMDTPAATGDVEPPDWISAQEGPSVRPEAESTEDLPDWLREMEAEAPVPEGLGDAAAAAEDLPDWLVARGPGITVGGRRNPRGGSR